MKMETPKITKGVRDYKRRWPDLPLIQRNAGKECMKSLERRVKATSGWKEEDEISKERAPCQER